MRLLVACLCLSGATELFSSMTITDGFVSNFVRPSPIEGATDCNRVFDVYIPERFFTHPEESFPIVYHLVGFGGTNRDHSATDKLVMDDMIKKGQAVPMIIIALDPSILNYTSSFYIDSQVVGSPNQSFNGQFEQYMVQELIPYVNEKYRQKTTDSGDAAPFRAIMGQSMGGYGSLYFAVKYPNLFCACAGDSPTATWLLTTNLASAPSPGFPTGNPMVGLNFLLVNKLPNNTPPGSLSPPGVNFPPPSDDEALFFGLAGAFSPSTPGLPPTDCTLNRPPCTIVAPYCVFYPFLTTVAGGSLFPIVVNNTLFSNPSIISVWQQFDPYFLLDAANIELLKRQALYLDAGADLATEPVVNVGARYFSDKLNSLDVNNEYLLFDGGHISCLSLAEIECYRFTTNLKLFSGKFSEAGIFAPDVRMTIVGDMEIILSGSAVMSIVDRALVGVETDHDAGITSTDVTLRIIDSARLEIGTKQTLGGGFQVGNAFSKANILNDPTRADDTISFTLEINGPRASVQIGKQGYLGFGVGIDGNQTDVPNFWGVSSLTNVTNVVLNFLQGTFLHNQIASSLDDKAALLALGEVGGYTVNLNQDTFVLSGGANLAMMQEANRIHPTVQTTAGTIDPGGIRNRIVEVPTTEFDAVFGPPKGVYASQTFSKNLMTVGILSSSDMLFDTNKTPLPTDATQLQLFNYLTVADYAQQGRKSSPISLLDNELTLGIVTPQAGGETIARPTLVQEGTCNPLGASFNTGRALQEGAVGVKLATINGQQEVIRVYELDPVV